MVDNQKEYWKRVLYPPDSSGVNSLVEFEQGGVNPIGALIFPIGTTAQRPSSPINGMMRYNTTLGDFEFFNGTWQSVSGVGGVALSNLEDADMDTTVNVEATADDDTIAATIGDNSGNFAVGGDILSFSTGGFQIDTPSATSGITTGVSLSFTTGGGNSTGAGGAFALTTGTGGATGGGGDITINGGQGGATSGAGGSIALTAGSTPVNGAGGTISLTAGDAGSGVPGGDITMTAGDSGSGSVGGAITLTGGGGGSTGGGITLTAGVPDGSGIGGSIAITAGVGNSNVGGSITITSGSASEANAGSVSIVGGSGTGGGDGGSVFINSGSGDTTDGIVQLQIDGTEGMTVEIDGTLSVPLLTAGGGTYESQVTDDDDIPNKKYVDDTIAAAPFVPFTLPSFMATIVPTLKAALGPLGVGSAIHPSGSFAFITDDATGPGPFILAYVDAGPTWVRSDTLAPIT